MPVIWPLIFYFGLVGGLVTAMLVLSAILGERHQAPATGLPYEGGTEGVGGAQLRLSARFYLVAMFFVVFDLESAFIISWAVALRPSGWSGYAEMAGFIGVLLLTLFYVARVGALDWNRRNWPSTGAPRAE